MRFAVPKSLPPLPTPHEPLSDELGVKLFVFGSAAAFLGIAGLVVVIVVKFIL